MKSVIRELRVARGLSQGDLAQAMAVSRQTINAIETERYTPSLPLAISLARYFGRTIEELFTIDEDVHV
ncbi:MAG: helix-turn-helix transcriptional regulator [Gemmatimonadaceae bacterium]